jgi:hypothetical protein
MKIAEVEALPIANQDDRGNTTTVKTMPFSAGSRPGFELFQARI